MSIYKLALSIMAAVALSGCFSQRLAVYEGYQPALKLEDYFDGCVVGYGVVKDWRGEVASRFKVNIVGTRAAGGIVLDEQFVYADGSRSERIWTIKNNAGTYFGTAPDVVGEAEGRIVGNALNWVYDLRLPRGDDYIVVTLDDWLYLLPEGVMLNTTEITKFGISVGSLVITFQKFVESALCVEPPDWKG